MKTGSFDQSMNGSELSDCLLRIQRHSRYFAYIFPEIPVHARMRYTLDISMKYRYFSIFRRNIGDFPDIIPILISTDYRFAISYQYRPIFTIFFVPWVFEC